MRTEEMASGSTSSSSGRDGNSGNGGRLRVAVLLSGGVDSSLALQLLVAAGHSCRAFYLQIWFQVRQEPMPKRSIDPTAEFMPALTA